MSIKNNWYIDWCQQYPDRILGFATVQPLAGQAALDEVKRAVDCGLSGVGEILPFAQNHSIRDDAFLAVVELTISLNIPLCLHGAEPVGHDYPGRAYTALQDYVWLAEQYPELKLILAHLGGLLPFYELNRYTKKVMANVYYDTAAVPLLYQPAVLQSSCGHRGGRRRFLFGFRLSAFVVSRKKPDPRLYPIID